MRIIARSSKSTHLVPLIRAINATKGTVAEFGAGDFSTPVMHEVMKGMGRKLITFENNPEWFANFIDLKTDWHEFTSVKDWSKIEGKFSVILIDHAPAERRIIDIAKFKDSAEILVVHDTDDKVYGYEKIWELFKYRFTYKRWTRTTTMLSNSINVANL